VRGKTECDRFGLNLRRILLAAVLASAISLSYAGSAMAATALVGPSTAFPAETAFIYIADAGETNNVTITVALTPPFDLEIVDPGATITVGSGCTSVDPHSARCSSYELNEDALEVDLGDGGDFLSVAFANDDTRGSFHGGDGNDTIEGGSGGASQEYLFGDAGNDVLRGGGGEDILDGGLGADILGGGSSTVCLPAKFCPADIDTVTYATRTNDVFVDADGVADDGEALEGDLVRGNIERITGGSGNDVLSGSVTREGSIEGKPFLRGTILNGGPGNDSLFGGRAVDTLGGGRGSDVLRGLGRGDFMWGDRGNDRLTGGRGSDQLKGGGGRDLLRGNAGSDRLLARDGRADRVYGGYGTDKARIDSGLDHVRGIEILLP
jgi:Ca2+-binding RTX toxin-like protein